MSNLNGFMQWQDFLCLHNLVNCGYFEQSMLMDRGVGHYAAEGH